MPNRWPFAKDGMLTSGLLKVDLCQSKLLFDSCLFVCLFVFYCYYSRGAFSSFCSPCWMSFQMFYANGPRRKFLTSLLCCCCCTVLVFSFYFILFYFIYLFIYFFSRGLFRGQNARTLEHNWIAIKRHCHK